MMLPPALPAPVSPATTTAIQVLASARNYQDNASMFRLGKTATLPPPNHNLQKAASVVKERRERARVLGQKGDHMIAVIASLWKVEGSSKERQVYLI